MLHQGLSTNSLPQLDGWLTPFVDQLHGADLDCRSGEHCDLCQPR
jgi:hypothetical protein